MKLVRKMGLEPKTRRLKTLKNKEVSGVDSKGYLVFFIQLSKSIV